MLFIKLLSAIASLFAVYPLMKLARKDEVNIFDLIILFHTIFYCLIPLFSDYSAFQWLKGFSFEDDIIFRISLYYTISIAFLLIADVFWTKHYKYRKSILNITYYIRILPQLEVSWVFLALLFINLIISWVWYLPQASYFDTFSEFTKTQGYALKSPLFLLYGAVFTFCFSISLLLYLKENLSFKNNAVLVFTLLGFALLLLFMPRRIMLFYMIVSLIITYSIKRNYFTKKKIAWFIVILFVILKIYFPFYNVMRRTAVDIDSSNFATSLIHIIEDTNSRFESKKESAAETSEGRALNLYYALYRIIKYDKSPSNGKLFVAAIDHALPKFVNPNKGNGTEIILEKKMFVNTDQADSILILAYGEFGLFVGTVYSFLLFVLIISIHALFEKINSVFSHNFSMIAFLLVVYLISFSWNVEGKLDGCFASFVHLAIMSIILMLLGRFNIIGNKKYLNSNESPLYI